MNKRTCPPILFVTFNRPDLASEVFSEIRKAQPERFFFASDGPRESIPEDQENISELRAMVLSGIDWPCEVKTLLREKNVGLPNANIDAISWFFEHEESGIVLEDDTLPHESFFPFCAELLERYRDDDRVMHISGFNAFETINSHGCSYYFSEYGHIWGWASWRRAWGKLDFNLKTWPKIREMSFSSEHPFSAMYNGFEKAWRGSSKSGLIRWYYSIALNSGLYIVPQHSLVKNIGFREDGTSFRDPNYAYAKIEGANIDFPLVHPEFMVENHEYNMARVQEKAAVPQKNIFMGGVRKLVKFFRRFLYIWC